MKIAKLEFTPINIPYTHREVSSQVNRDGVSDVIVKATTDDGLVGWGEACSGANLASVEEALRAMPLPTLILPPPKLFAKAYWNWE